MVFRYEPWRPEEWLSARWLRCSHAEACPPTKLLRLCWAALEELLRLMTMTPVQQVALRVLAALLQAAQAEWSSQRLTAYLRRQTSLACHAIPCRAAA